jgi:hypothetical protein
MKMQLPRQSSRPSIWPSILMVFYGRRTPFKFNNHRNRHRFIKFVPRFPLEIKLGVITKSDILKFAIGMPDNRICIVTLPKTFLSLLSRL